MNKIVTRFALLLFVLISATQFSAAQEGNKNSRFKVDLTVTDKNTKESVIMASCSLSPLGAFTVTNIDGKASFDKIPEGTYTLNITYVGYEDYHTTLKVASDLNLNIKLYPTSLALKEVVVTARQNVSGTSTSSLISRQAIDHLQASSLADVMQLVPGQLIQNTDLTAQSNIQLRTLTNNNTSAFGSSVVVDGMPISNNGALTQGQFSASAFTGTDLRQISADDIDNVEVIRGIPSAEYGDLSSGLVVVHSKVGVTPWQIKGKINPELQNYSVGKGFNLEKLGIINFNLDYAKAWGDPRQKTRSYGRYTGSVGYGYDISRRWHTDTKVRFLFSRQWSGNDPDAIQDGTETKNINANLNFTHNGKISVNKSLMRTLSYTLGFRYGWQDDRATGYVGSTNTAILTARETGYYEVPWVYGSYLATGRTKANPGNIFAKINDAFYLKAGKTRQNFKLGIEYKYDWTSGKGYYNEDDNKPYRPNADGRPRAFSDIPGLHQFSAYAEDNLTWNINKVNRLRTQVGVRFTALQPFSDIATYALSPRLNMSFALTKWLDLRAGIGMNSKTPGLNYLYPDKKYVDRIAASYMPQNDEVAQILAYHTYVYDVKKSKDLKNATTTKVEAGADVKLPWGGKLSVLAYKDKTPNGFGAATEYTTYTANYYDINHGLVINPGQATTINYNDPARTDLLMITTGKIGNTNTTENKGVEFDFNFGEIKPIHTSFYLSGAYSETKIWSTDMNSESVRGALLPAEYSIYNTTPFKVVYPSGQDYDRYHRFLNTLRVVTNIPRLRMVASFTAQVIWQDWRENFQTNKNAIGWIDGNLNYHDITPDMMDGVIDMSGIYHASAPAGMKTVAIRDLSKKATNYGPQKTPSTWNLSARLTKELGKLGGFSLYVNNCLYYEPYLQSNTTTTWVQRNTNSFSYGVELFFNL